MSFWSKIKMGLAKFFAGRNGVDALGWALFVLILILNLSFSFTRLAILYYLGMAGWIYMIFRMLSRNIDKRRRENDWFLSRYTPVKTSLYQARVRFKNRKIYLYYRCPQCKAWLKMPRHIGEKHVTCGKCGAQFTKKA